MINYIVTVQKILSVNINDILFLPKPFLNKLVEERLKLEEKIEKESKKRMKRGEDSLEVELGERNYEQL